MEDVLRMALRELADKWDSGLLDGDDYEQGSNAGYSACAEELRQLLEKIS